MPGCQEWVRICAAANIPLSKTDQPAVHQEEGVEWWRNTALKAAQRVLSRAGIQCKSGGDKE